MAIERDVPSAVFVYALRYASVSDIKSVPLNYGNSISINMGVSDSISHIKSIAGNRGLELKESYLAQSGEEVLIYSAGVSGVSDGIMTGVNYGECSGSMKPDTREGGKITTKKEVFDEQKATFLYS